MILAIVVLPVPGGPQRIMEGILPCSIAVRRMLPLPVRCSWPTRSSSVRGRIRSASGVAAFIVQITEEKGRKGEWFLKFGAVSAARFSLHAARLIVKPQAVSCKHGQSGTGLNN